MTVQPKSLTQNPSLLQFSDNLFYRFEGDHAQLGAQLRVNDPASVTQQRCSLQLWACPSPFEGGELNGVRIAEVPVVTQAPEATIQQAAPAQFPAGQHDFAMVMALVTETADGQPVINDFVNFNQRQRFLQPCMAGAVDVSAQEQQVSVSIASIENPRENANLSGSLSVELWASQTASYSGGGVDGQWLAGVNLGQLAGGQQWTHQVFTLDVNAAPAQSATWLLLLREWTAAGYVTRDFRVVPVLMQSIAPAKATAKKAKTEAKAVKSETKAGTVSVNSASEDELANIKGLNPKLARLIVAGRPYLALDELVQVRGIGEKMINKLRSLLSL